MRVIAGKFGRRLLRGAGRLKLRPTSDRLRETLFSVLESGGLSGALEGSVFVDAFAGTGAVGIEALSRGAARAVFIENHSAAVRLIRANLALLGISDGADVLQSDVMTALRRLAAQGTRADFVFLDPPYANYDAAIGALEALDKLELLSPGGCAVLEHARRRESPAQMGRLARARLLRQGDSALSFYRPAAAAGAALTRES
jgi:16S rRNA (guanine(966)-N(2))-methyltransferase RsmD